jgi:cathepsin L
MTLNHFADYTPDELKVMLGYKRVGPRWEQAGASSFVEQSSSGLEKIDVSALAKEVDWTRKMNFSNIVHDQGACGSCWAHAAVSALEAHAELATGLDSALSTQEIIDCSPNPRHCGGSGGCHGATAEIAFELARNRGVSLNSKYKGSKGTCGEADPAALKVRSFVRLPENKATHLMNALANHGTIPECSLGAMPTPLSIMQC